VPSYHRVSCASIKEVSQLFCGLINSFTELNRVLIAFAMIGKMCITASYGVIYIFTAESFPTVVRNGGVGASSMFARVGGIVANSLLVLVS